MNGSALTERLGGSELFGHEILSPLDWARALEEGFPNEAVDAAIERDLLSRDEAEHLVIPRRTLTHRRQKGQRLSLDESDRLLRIARVSAQAEAVLGNREKAHRWLRKPNRLMDGAVPLEMLRTSTGAEIVQEALIRIEHGIFA